MAVCSRGLIARLSHCWVQSTHPTHSTWHLNILHMTPKQCSLNTQSTPYNRDTPYTPNTPHLTLLNFNTQARTTDTLQFWRSDLAPKVPDCGLPTTDYRLQIAQCNRATNYRVHQNTCLDITDLKSKHNTFHRTDQDNQNSKLFFGRQLTLCREGEAPPFLAILVSL